MLEKSTMVYALLLNTDEDTEPQLTVAYGGEQHYSAIRSLVDGEEELNCYHLQLSMGRCWRIYWGYQGGRVANAAYARLYEDILSQAYMSGIPESLTGTVAIVLGVSRHYLTVDCLASFPSDYSQTAWKDAIRDSLLRIDRGGCMRTVVPRATGLWTGAESASTSTPTGVSRDDYHSVRAVDIIGSSARFHRRHAEEQQWRRSFERGTSRLDSLLSVIGELGVEVTIARPTPKGTVAKGPAPYLARLAVKASIADKGTCAVSLCAIGEEEVAMVPPCGHVCGPMARTLDECPTCRAPATWTEVRVADL